jgi:16S rRNA G966 N2-methylase RsmD
MQNKNQINSDGPAKSLKRALDYILNSEDKNSLPAKFLKLQKKLNAEERFLIRNDPQIVYEIFGININKLKLNDYYCWDSTTLSLFFFLKSFFQSFSNLKVLELGCGPHATLSVSLKKQFNLIHFSASDIIESRVNSAILTSKINNVKIDFIVSDLFNNIDPKFDVIFMNPPYVPTKYQKQIIGDESLDSFKEEEWRSGHGNEDGLFVVNRFLDDALLKLNKNGFLVLGINNYFVSDNKLRRLFKQKGYATIDTYKKQTECTPNGHYSQVYLLNNRN